VKDLTIRLEDRPGALADLGEALGRAGVSIEGGGAFIVGDEGIAHVLVAESLPARKALQDAGIHLIQERDVVVQRLHQDRPGQLGMLCRRMAEAGVNIEVLYTDHAQRLVLVVDEVTLAQQVSAVWQGPDTR
jgi:hypothetical protein